jgi:SAM-dependent methyltransferase
MDDHHGHPADDAAAWDERYRGDGDHLWSGAPNATLMAEVADLPPGTAFDVGCGEGADAIWLAEHGWRVTAADPSRVALERAEAAAREVGVDVTWVHAGLLDMPGGTGRHDLVAAHYPALVQSQDGAAIAALLGAVAPGGTLLVVHHATAPVRDGEHAFDPADYVMPADVAAHLDDGWEVEVDEVRPPPRARRDGHVVDDVVLRARRRPRATG